MLASVKEELGDDVYFISLTVEPEDDKEAVENWLDSSNASSLNAGKSSAPVAQRLHAMAGIEAGPVPSSILINAEGEVVGGHLGVPSREQMLEWARQISP